MNKKVFYINELLPSNGYFKFDHHRLPQAYIDLFPWYCVTWDSIEKEITGKDNIIFIQTPTNNELQKLKIIQKLLENNIVFINQESSVFDWFDWPGEEQSLYVDILSKCKGFCYHSDHDKKIMSIFTNNFIKYPGCANLVVDSPKQEESDYILVPNPTKGYQRGVISQQVALKYKQHLKVFSMSYNRPNPQNTPIKKLMLPYPDNYILPEMNLLGFMPLDKWWNTIYASKFGIDIHREFAGGNVSLEFGSFGVPLIGNINLDTQRDIFPDLSFEHNDYEGIKKAIDLLINDKEFYNEVCIKAIQNVKEKYNSQLIVDKFKSDILKLL